MFIKRRTGGAIDGRTTRVLADVILTKDELDGLMANLLLSDSAPLGHMRFSEWISANAATLGKRYASEIGCHYWHLGAWSRRRKDKPLLRTLKEINDATCLTAARP